MTTLEAHQRLFTGTANVAQTAAALGIPTAQLMASFRAYCAENPIDPDGWAREITLAWPFA